LPVPSERDHFADTVALLARVRDEHARLAARVSRGTAAVSGHVWDADVVIETAGQLLRELEDAALHAMWKLLRSRDVATVHRAIAEARYPWLHELLLERAFQTARADWTGAPPAHS
jgi:hypothetical protein